jgi:hypothetical protein
MSPKSKLSQAVRHVQQGIRLWRDVYPEDNPKKVVELSLAFSEEKAASTPKKKAKASTTIRKTQTVAKSRPSAQAKKRAKLSRIISIQRAAVANGDIPPLKERLETILANGPLAIRDMIPILRKKKWLPVAQDISTYLCYVLGQDRKTFSRVSRGMYRANK